MDRPSFGKRNLVLKSWERHYGPLDTIARLHFTNDEDVLFLAGLDYAVFAEAIKTAGPELADIRRAASTSLGNQPSRSKQDPSGGLVLPEELVHRLIEHQGRRGGGSGVIAFAEYWMKRWRKIPNWDDGELEEVARLCRLFGDMELLEKAIRAESQIARIVEYCDSATLASAERGKRTSRKGKAVRKGEEVEGEVDRRGHQSIGPIQDYQDDT